jgi:hypothetical protein
MAEQEELEALIKERRTKLDPTGLAESAGVWGLALSGGGIRSATFCLGLLRALAKRDMLLRFDLLSTVSGGGYIGSTLGRLLSRATNSAEVAAVSKAFADANARWFTWWLRANGRYLIPRGAKDTTFAVALYLRNLTAIHFELGVLALLLGAVLACVDIAGWGLIGYLGYEFNSAFFDAIRYLPDWLPVLALLLPPTTVLGAVVASAYWCIPWLVATETEPSRPLLYWAGAVLFAVALIVLRGPFTSIQADIGQTLRQVLWWVAMILVIAWLASLPMATYVLKKESEADSQLKADQARNRLTGWLANILRFGAVLVLLGGVDRFAWYLAFELTPTQQASAGIALAVAAAVARAVLPAIAEQMQQRGSTGLVLLIGRAFGYALTFLLCSWWVSLIHHAALGAAFQRVSPRFGDTVVVLLSIGLPALAYLLLTGRSMSFLNLSSLHTFYRARLVRSYLGAANSKRFQGNATEELPHPMPVAPTRVDVGALERDDDIGFLSYKPQQHGGPIHIINVCVNQTRDPRGGLFNLDRKGLLLSVASTGHMRLSQDSWQQMPEKNQLTLGTWTAISGAAIAPGLGSLSRGGISALATFAGLRLGYWWNAPGVKGPTPSAQEGRPPLLTKSVGLLRETFGIFRGIDHPDWFLTDGGHFENTGAYALLAQRAEVIVLADCGADPDYSFGDLENLVRKARIDLQAEILFQRPKEHPQKPEPQGGAKTDDSLSPAWPEEMDVFGSLNDLASQKSSSCLALARINYGGQRPGKGILIVVKPNVADGLPVDLVNFKAQNAAFPQETTADQFFSEAQWESYFELGHFLGGKLTKGFVQSLPKEWSTYFEPDERSPFEKTADDSEDAKGNAKDSAASRRLPARISATTVGATLGLGAAATVGVSVWQAIDSIRTSSAKQVADERAALKELTDLWARLPPAVSAASAPVSVNALASAIVRTADTLCPANDAGWFQRSAVAEKVYTAALEQCKALKERPQACITLLEAAQPALQSKLPNCLVREERATDAIPPPRYWVYDYSSDAPFARAHPCDQAAWERHRADELYRSGVLKLDAAWSSIPQDAAVMWRPLAECFVTTRAARFRAAFLGPKEPSIEEASLASQDPAPVASASATQAASAVAVQPTPASSAAAVPAAASAAPPPPPAPPPPAPSTQVAFAGNICAGKTIYLQIYEPAQRDSARSFREPWRALGASVPPVEDVSASARAAGRATPSPVRVTTVRYHEPSSRECAQTLKVAAGRGDWTVEPLSARLKPSPGVIEVWIPPAKKAD